MSEKQEVLRLIQELKKQVDAGLRDIAEGRVITHEELKARIAKWRDSAGR